MEKKGIRESPASAAALHLGRAGAFASWGVKPEMMREVRKGRGRLEGRGLSGDRAKDWVGGGEIGALMPKGWAGGWESQA